MSPNILKRKKNTLVSPKLFKRKWELRLQVIVTSLKNAKLPAHSIRTTMYEFTLVLLIRTGNKSDDQTMSVNI